MQQQDNKASNRRRRSWTKLHTSFRTEETYRAHFENVLKEAASYLIHDGQTVLDCGANVGKHALNFAKYVGDEGLVVAIEPSPQTYAVLENRIRRNVNAHRIQTLNCAVGAVSKSIDFFHNKKHPALSSAIEASAGNPEQLERHSMRCRKVDNLREIKSGVDFIKIDVGRFEFEVFKGAEKTLKKHKPPVFFENNRGAGENSGLYTKEEFFGFFEKLGYVIAAANGMIIDASTWHLPGPTSFMAFPESRSTDCLEALSLANLKTLYFAK